MEAEDTHVSEVCFGAADICSTAVFSSVFSVKAEVVHMLCQLLVLNMEVNFFGRTESVKKSYQTGYVEKNVCYHSGR